MNFVKMHGCGNDFVVVTEPVEMNAARARALCDRRRGIGADGVLVLGTHAAGRWPVHLWNADGSVGESCGNGARCIARYLLDREGGDEVELAFAGGGVRARRDPMGIAITIAAPATPTPLAIDGLRSYRVRVGNPHVVAFVDDPLTVDLPALAAAARRAAGDANVGAARLAGADLLVLRVDERGVGETLACGTGACAAVAAAACEARVAETVRVRLPGGELFVRPGGGTYELAGPADYVFEGSVP